MLVTCKDDARRDRPAHLTRRREGWLRSQQTSCGVVRLPVAEASRRARPCRVELLLPVRSCDFRSQRRRVEPGRAGSSCCKQTGRGSVENYTYVSVCVLVRRQQTSCEVVRLPVAEASRRARPCRVELLLPVRSCDFRSQRRRVEPGRAGSSCCKQTGRGSVENYTYVCVRACVLVWCRALYNLQRSHIEKEPAPKDISDIDPNRIICWKTFPVHEGKADNTAVIRVFGNVSMYSRGKRDIPEKPRQPAASSGTIPTFENTGATPAENRARDYKYRLKDSLDLDLPPWRSRLITMYYVERAGAPLVPVLDGACRAVLGGLAPGLQPSAVLRHDTSAGRQQPRELVVASERTSRLITMYYDERAGAPLVPVLDGACRAVLGGLAPGSQPSAVLRHDTSVG
ncbi:hypothetical protein PR048_018865 [Dryococelus australis]|uniref:Uncharacterized protein n=1 Tax=Dryococelus australis TaxID=614101 RepID=A0ABQ9H280_9NEOP|nr:hypothetical protein PR048_018865 [Dryococelus australis]